MYAVTAADGNALFQRKENKLIDQDYTTDDNQLQFQISAVMDKICKQLFQ